MTTRDYTTYDSALKSAREMMHFGVEPRSALKQAASDRGIEFGGPMRDFVLWAEDHLYS